MSLYMETTKIPASKTIGEIQALLAGTRAVRAIQIEYGPTGEVAALSFLIGVKGHEVPFRLPAKVDPVFCLLQKRRSPKFRTRGETQDLEQAERVAWRQILRWVQAQIALTETGMVTIAEVFLPYAQVSPTESLYQRWLGYVEGGKLLPAPGRRSDGSVPQSRRHPVA